MSRPNEKTEEAEVKRPPDGMIRFEVDNIHSLGLRIGDDVTYGRCSPEVEAGGVGWRAVVKYNAYDDGLCVRLVGEASQLAPWSTDVDVECTLVHTDNTKNMTKKDDSDTVMDGCNFTRYVNLMDWDEVIENNKGFIIDDKITLEIRFWITNMKGIRHFPRVDFTDPKDPRHNVTFVIEGEKIHANKAILASHSKYFNSLFFGEFAEKEKNEIELKDVDREEFLEMLRIIYYPSKKITRPSAEFLLKLSDVFQNEYLMDRVEKWVMDDQHWFDIHEKLKISDKFRLIGLQDKCLDGLTTKDEFKELKKSPVYDDLSDALKAKLLTRLIEIIERE